jgi:hypothetical protein
MNQLRLAGGRLDGPIGGAERPVHAGWDMILAIKMVQAKAQAKGDGRMLVREVDEIAHTHGSIMQLALHGAV